MKKKIILTVLLGVFLIGMVAAQEINFENISCQNLLSYQSEVVGVEIPNKVPYQNEIFNIYISENIFGNVIIEEGVILDFGCIENENATYKIYIKSYEVFNDFMNSEDEIGLFQEKLKNKEIEIKGVGIGKKLKLFFTKIGLRLFG